MKQERLNLRTTPEQKRVLEEAAGLARQTVTAFVLDAAWDAAQRLVAEQTTYPLGEDAWRRFCDALEGPPVELPRLRAFLATPSVLET